MQVIGHIFVSLQCRIDALCYGEENEFRVIFFFFLSSDFDKVMLRVRKDDGVNDR